MGTKVLIRHGHRTLMLNRYFDDISMVMCVDCRLLSSQSRIPTPKVCIKGPEMVRKGLGSSYRV